jgi:hypothetical protein
VVSFNEFDYNSSTLYNFKVDEETFNKLVSANLKVSLDEFSVSGSIGMIKLLMSKGYKLEYSIPLDKVVKPGDELVVKSPSKKDPKKGPKGKESGKKQDAKKKEPVAVKPSMNETYSYPVGHLKI